ncbi:FAD-binding and (Fe-S)-binding domain-containing protein [Streptomyces alkaliphilus]|nr:FAD-binding and (Fe-S)-binding domain-containing protein [Streptomyces alkaliphilus]
MEGALRAAVRGEIGFTAGDRALMTMDASNHRRVPLGVVAPRDADDLAAALAICHEHGVPVVPRGGGTSIAGQATGVGVVLDFTRHMNRVLAIDPQSRTAEVEPGVIRDELCSIAAPHGLVFGPDPSTHSRCTIGGMIGNNACGSHSVAVGTTADNVLALDLLTRDGRALRADPGGSGLPDGLRDAGHALVDAHAALLRTGMPKLPRRISGYALDRLLPEHGRDWARALTGSEGTLAVLTRATVRLLPVPAARALAVIGYPDESSAAEAAPGLLPLRPLTLEGMSQDLIGGPDPGRRAAAGALLPRGGAWLFAETGGDTPAEARARAAALCRAAADGAVAGTVVEDPTAQRSLWRMREEASGTATRAADGGEAWPGWEDCAVPPARLGAYLRDFRALLREHGLRGVPYGHFGDGCVHVRIDFDLLTAPGVARYRAFSGDLARLVVSHGGSLSGEHGDGLARAELLPLMYGDAVVDLFHRFKDLWDPGNGLNPGVLARPDRLDDNLRFTPLPREPVPVAFGYPGDSGDFSAAVRRCVGVAKCRVNDPGTGVMCPSWRVTREERHSTRGRARLLHEMLAGEVVTDGWRSTEVRDALDLCLSCKGCRSDCPVGVDMATYKAEFLHHHWAGRIRPAAHYSMGSLPRWLRLAAALRAAPPANAAARVPPLAALAKRLGGIDPGRDIPPLPRAPLHRRPSVRAVRRPVAGIAAEAAAARGDGSGPRAVLFPDTFTAFLSPEAGEAALRVLGAAGVRTSVPREPVCCGLTWISTGRLDTARRVQRRTLERLSPLVEAGLTITVAEPPCAAALRSDLPELLHDDPRAETLAASVRTFAETLEELAPEWDPPRVDRPLVGQTHCHQHAVLGDTADRRLRERAGLTGEPLTGCCGLAGNFGFERGHLEVSAACAEERLLPAVRAADPGAVLVADGYSCRLQIAQLGPRDGRPARHLAEVLADALPADGEDPGRKG